MSTRLTLLCGANPTRAQRGPSVRLQAGNWRFRHDGCVNTTFFVMLESSNIRVPVVEDHILVIEESQNVYVDFETRGKERYVSIYLERVA